MPNSWQQPEPTEPGGASWHKVADPSTGWFDSKTSGWTADSFTSSTTGLDIDFSPVVPAGTRAVMVYGQCAHNTAGGRWYARSAGDTNISTNPDASGEYSHALGLANANSYTAGDYVLFLSADYRSQITVYHADYDVYFGYPKAYLL